MELFIRRAWVILNRRRYVYIFEKVHGRLKTLYEKEVGTAAVWKMTRAYRKSAGLD